MLKSISSTVLRQPIFFDAGLNIVLGDKNGSNSIGKSSSLLLVDFCFGGDSYIALKKDAIVNLGHHAIDFVFEFDSIKYSFSRSTEEPGVVKFQKNQSSDSELSKELKLSDFNRFLKNKYQLSELSRNFRALVSLYLRIWKKGNDQSDRPLHVFARQPTKDAIENLSSLFHTDSSVLKIQKEIEEVQERKENLNKAFKTEYLSQISKKQHELNSKEVERCDSEINEIRGNLAMFATNINEIINRTVLDLKTEKDQLIAEKYAVERRIRVSDSNMASMRHVSAKNFEKLNDFFPDINIQKLQEVEAFHTGISKILNKEIQASREEAISLLAKINERISSIDEQISASTSKVENPGAIIDRTVELLQRRNTLNRENSAYAEYGKIKESIETKSSAFQAEKQIEYKSLAEKINLAVLGINSAIYGNDSPCPRFTFFGSDYEYAIPNDTGTGRSYANFLMFDIAVFENTSLPVVAHDSYLLKNIENDILEKLIARYQANRKQSFVSLDELSKYGETFQTRVQPSIKLKLDRNSPLYIKSWKSAPNEPTDNVDIE